MQINTYNDHGLATLGLFPQAENIQMGEPRENPAGASEEHAPGNGQLAKPLPAVVEWQSPKIGLWEIYREGKKK